MSQSAKPRCTASSAVGALGLLGVEILARLSATGTTNVEGLVWRFRSSQTRMPRNDANVGIRTLNANFGIGALAWRFGFVGALLINLKQANPVLLALVTAGLLLVALRDPAIQSRRLFAQLPRMLGPAIFLFALWRWYVSQNLPNAEQAFRPVDTWNFVVLRQIFGSVVGLVADAPLFHA